MHKASLCGHAVALADIVDDPRLKQGYQCEIGWLSVIQMRNKGVPRIQRIAIIVEKAKPNEIVNGEAKMVKALLTARF